MWITTKLILNQLVIPNLWGWLYLGNKLCMNSTIPSKQLHSSAISEKIKSKNERNLGKYNESDSEVFHGATSSMETNCKSHRKSRVPDLQSHNLTVSRILKELCQVDPANNTDKFCFMPKSLIIHHSEKLFLWEDLLPLGPSLLRYHSPLQHFLLEATKYLCLIKTYFPLIFCHTYKQRKICWNLEEYKRKLCRSSLWVSLFQVWGEAHS